MKAFSVLTGPLEVKAARHRPPLSILRLGENDGIADPVTMTGDIGPAQEVVDLKGIDKAALANIDPSPIDLLIMSSYSLTVRLSLH
jgi:hypothetical protein